MEKCPACIANWEGDRPHHHCMETQSQIAVVWKVLAYKTLSRFLGRILLFSQPSLLLVDIVIIILCTWEELIVVNNDGDFFQ